MKLTGVTALMVIFIVPHSNQSKQIITKEGTFTINQGLVPSVVGPGPTNRRLFGNNGNIIGTLKSLNPLKNQQASNKRPNNSYGPPKPSYNPPKPTSGPQKPFYNPPKAKKPSF